MKMEHRDSNWNKQFHLLQQQHQLVIHLTQVIMSIKGLTVSRPKKLTALKEKLVLPRKEIGSSFADFPPVPLPMDPSIFIDGIMPARFPELIKCRFYS